MTTQTPAPQIPQQLAELMDTWGRKHGRIGEIDAEITRIEPAMAELQRQLAELNNRHADLGRQRHEAVEEAKFARDMVEHGCQLAGAPVPPTAPLAPAPQGLTPVQLQPPAPPAPRDVSGDPFAIPANRIGDPAPLPPGADASPGETVTDHAAPKDAGGDQPDPGFQAEPGQAESDARRRRGGRRAQ